MSNHNKLSTFYADMLTKPVATITKMKPNGNLKFLEKQLSCLRVYEGVEKKDEEKENHVWFLYFEEFLLNEW